MLLLVRLDTNSSTYRSVFPSIYVRKKEVDPRMAVSQLVQENRKNAQKRKGGLTTPVFTPGDNQGQSGHRLPDDGFSAKGKSPNSGTQKHMDRP